MANGWAPGRAVQDQIHDTLRDALSIARPYADRPERRGTQRMRRADTGAPARALPGVRTCVACEADPDRASTLAFFGINRRGSKDSQVR